MTVYIIATSIVKNSLAVNQIFFFPDKKKSNYERIDILIYLFILNVFDRPGTSPSEIQAYTLDHHMQTWQSGDSLMGWNE